MIILTMRKGKSQRRGQKQEYFERRLKKGEKVAEGKVSAERGGRGGEQGTSFLVAVDSGDGRL